MKMHWCLLAYCANQVVEWERLLGLGSEELDGLLRNGKSWGRAGSLELGKMIEKILGNKNDEKQCNAVLSVVFQT